MGSEMPQVLVRLPPDLYDELRLHAESEERSLAADVRLIVRRYFADRSERM